MHDLSYISVVRMANLITFVVILKHIIMSEDISTDWALMSDSALSAYMGAFK